ncbi:hypothetical protein F8154_10180 [Alkaliphilus pronyensis]|uniref:Uncharacterized protein n=1 Tax=Alkaliphilus pronyensis TaxID=1482732 RepID=A0A6I0F778_9FIRM|nr:hypothetical protein [Alkaliphilus pronyensis]KAB3534037.1 hypothetical protein F8154_10180 [Alkaliphilus pronyensis]
MLYGTVILIGLFMLLLGYIIGRKIGAKEGYQKALNHVPMELKLNLYENKKCPICNSITKDMED